MPIPGALETDFQEEAISPAYLWKITRVDTDPGIVLGFTEHNRDIVYDSITYKAATGFSATAVDKTSALTSDSLSVRGIYGTDSAMDILKQDVFAGRYRGAVMELMVINFEDLTSGHYLIFKGFVGETRDLGDQFQMEIFSFDHKLKQEQGRRVMPLCDAEFGDARCGLNIASFTFSGAVTAITSNSVFSDTISAGIIDKDPDYFGAGLIRWLTGDNEGLLMDVKSFSGTQVFTLYEAAPYVIQVGDTFEAIAGCRKRKIEDCKTKFNNIVNHRGYPDVPGDRFMTTYAQPR